MSVALDADVLIGALDASDHHHPDARRLFFRWRRDHIAGVISVVSLTEVLVAPAADRARLRTARAAIAALGVVIDAPGEGVGVDASVLRQRHPISLPDAYCLATARHRGAAVASFDAKVVRAARAEGIDVQTMT
ncbi:MAG: type II toxin-antitoxin system VapC family toxin [Candidatus Dormibacteraeota bacterium]|nr:type II toxin-antitoxin system VapC family toxin [Candidatus Dormibacteraeota bacterium]